jgi:hypothetical protein
MAIFFMLFSPYNRLCKSLYFLLNRTAAPPPGASFRLNVSIAVTVFLEMVT